MKLLAIDTSTDRASVALSINDDVRSKEQGAQRQHAQFILPMIEQLLAEGGLMLSQLDGIVYGRGPGSFTGLRIACSVAKGLAYADDLLLFPVSSLAAIAYDTLHGACKEANQSLQTCQTPQLKDIAVLAMIDARMNQLYWAFFSDPCQAVVEQVSDASVILACSDQDLVLAGVGYEPYLNQLSPLIHAKTKSHRISYPKAEAMIHLALTGHIEPIKAVDAVPSYIRNQITQGASHG